MKPERDMRPDIRDGIEWKRYWQRWAQLEDYAVALRELSGHWWVCEGPLKELLADRHLVGRHNHYDDEAEARAAFNRAAEELRTR